MICCIRRLTRATTGSSSSSSQELHKENSKDGRHGQAYVRPLVPSSPASGQPRVTAPEREGAASRTNRHQPSFASSPESSGVGLEWLSPPHPTHGYLCSPFGNSVAGNSEDTCLGVTNSSSCKLKERGRSYPFLVLGVFPENTEPRWASRISGKTAAESSSSQGPMILQSSLHFPLCYEAWPHPPCSLPTPSATQVYAASTVMPMNSAWSVHVFSKHGLS